MNLTSTLLPLIDLSRKDDGSIAKTAFVQDVAEGLGHDPKHLSSRYFYDSTGSRLFQQIMELPEYYLTRAEFEIFTRQKQGITEHFASGGFFHLIDLGAGDALKTKILLRHLQSEKQQFDYVPVDISGDAMQQLTTSLKAEMPGMQLQAVVGEYFEALEWLHEHKSERKVVLFLGSNIGNFSPSQSIIFLKKIRSYLQSGDKLLLGVDLRKDPKTILSAYDDAAGVTAAFNLNLLERINRELGANFDLGKFRHFATYQPHEGVMKSYLISQEEQHVHIKAIDRILKFSAWEAIHMENSYKYSLQQVKELGQTCGFNTETVFKDSQQYFADILFSVN
ncbi:L-histidine N(alpha)-methyltransferase [Pontibacter ruber]|uniref:L-histidine N(Alpha)-methyltransferase n=1 Tax=Pontibacter ruber TaxID=1343895 RepID=A0ABW5CSB9_9BACT|nr:L-histidine N(alpha)-methyltransferase [Pontibacter ruber]